MASLSSLSEEMPWTANSKERMKYLFDTGFLSDATLYLGTQKQKVKVHRFVLEFASPVFHQDFKKVKNNELYIKDVDPAIFLEFLRYIYLGECEAAVEDYPSLVGISTKYKVQNLMNFCTEELFEHFPFESMTRLFQKAMELELPAIVEGTLAYVCKMAKDLINSDCFLKFPQECPYEIYKHYDLSVSTEPDLCNALLKWGVAECQRLELDPKVPENVKDVLAEVLNWIITNFDIEEFLLKVPNKEFYSLLLFYIVSIEKRWNEIVDKIYTVSRSVGTTFFGSILSESFKLEVSKDISLVGFKLFVVPGWRDHVWNDFSNFCCIVLVESVPSGTFLYEREIKGFNFFKMMEFESVELESDCLYQITLSCSGSYKICYSDGKIYERAHFAGFHGLQSSCDLEYEHEEGTETVHFQFSRGDSSKSRLDKGIITELIFTIAK